jgi:hypothetical protein
MAECSAPYCHPRLNAVAATVNPAPSSGSAQVSRHHPRWEPGALAAPAGICVVTELGADTDPFLLHIYAALAEKERALISRRTKDALSAAKARGIVIGGLRDKGRELQAEAFERAEALRPVFAELADMSANAMANELNRRGVPTPRAALGMRARLFGFGVGWERCREALSCVACGSADDVQHHPLVSGNEEDRNLITLCPVAMTSCCATAYPTPASGRGKRARGVRRPRLPAKSVMMPNWQATLLSLAVAVAFYAFAVRWRAEIILLSTVALAGMDSLGSASVTQWPLSSSLASCAGSWARGDDKPKALQVAAILVRELLGEG